LILLSYIEPKLSINESLVAVLYLYLAYLLLLKVEENKVDGTQIE